MLNHIPLGFLSSLELKCQFHPMGTVQSSLNLANRQRKDSYLLLREGSALPSPSLSLPSSFLSYLVSHARSHPERRKERTSLTDGETGRSSGSRLGIGHDARDSLRINTPRWKESKSKYYRLAEGEIKAWLFC